MQNIVILAGNIGKDPESRTTQGGTDITNFTLATWRTRYAEGKPVLGDNGNRIRDTEWHRITAFAGLARTVGQYCSKGQKLLVRGEIHYTRWTDQDGVERYGCEIHAKSITFLSAGNGDQDGYDDDLDGE